MLKLRMRRTHRFDEKDTLYIGPSRRTANLGGLHKRVAL
jgi:hypothetical protein